MVWDEEASFYYPIVEEHIGNRYSIFQNNFNKHMDDEIIGIIKRIAKIEKLGIKELFIFFTLKLYDLIDYYCNSVYYFDQLFANYPSKGRNWESNEFISDGEIFNISAEFGLKNPNKNVIRQIFGRIRFFAKFNIWYPFIDYPIAESDYAHPKYYETENFHKYFKNYIDKNPKNLRYTELLRKTLIHSYYFHSNITLATNQKELNNILNSPLVFVILGPYNYLKPIFE